MGALTPLGKGPRPGREWVSNVAAYTLVGLGASMVVGAAVAVVGRAALPQGISLAELAAAAFVAAVAVAREIRLFALPLIQARRQTRGDWAKRYTGLTAAVLWGLDLGLVVTTWFTFAGVWLLFVTSAVMGDPLFGAVLFGTFWLGRAASVWLGPLFLTHPSATPSLLVAITRERALFQRMHVVGILGLMAALVSLRLMS